MEPLSITLVVLVALFLVASALLFKRLSDVRADLAVADSKLGEMAQQKTEDVEHARKEAELEARQLIADARSVQESENAEERTRLRENEEDLRRRRDELERSARGTEELQEKVAERSKELARKESGLERRDLEFASMRTELVEALGKVSRMSSDEARAELLVRIEEDSKQLIAEQIKRTEEEVTERCESTAKNIISMAIQRYAGEYTCERTVSVVPLPSDDLKGRIIGREGRNIRALEAATGVDFIIDDTPDCVVLSAFNPIRREVAKAALETLLEDGRIHPTRIETVVRKAETDFHRVIRAAGEEAGQEVGISGIHPEILKLLGALKYRTSYGQNQWQHSVEVAFLCGMMAAELGLDETLARRAGLLHDIGKVLDQTADGSHALIGAEFARKHGEEDTVVNAIASHHEEVEQRTIYACLAQAADAISGARPGARREMMQTHNQRLADLERISNSFPGVERSYAVQAGREIRVLVENASITDEEAVVLSRDIAQKIEREMSYPGQIKVTVIRETRVVQYAR